MDNDNMGEVHDPIDYIFNMILRAPVATEHFLKLISSGIFEDVLRFDPDKVDREKLREIMFPKPPENPPLYVRSSRRTIEEALVAGRHNFVNPVVNSANFRTEPNNFDGYVHVVPFVDGASAENTSNNLTVHGFRVLTSLELLNYSAAYKSHQRETTIVALGDYFEDENKIKWVLAVGSDDGSRIVYVVRLDGEPFGENFSCAYVKR